MLVLFTGYAGVAKILSSHGANVSATDKNGQTPLHRFLFFFYLNCVIQLCDLFAIETIRVVHWNSISSFAKADSVVSKLLRLWVVHVQARKSLSIGFQFHKISIVQDMHFTFDAVQNFRPRMKTRPNNFENSDLVKQNPANLVRIAYIQFIYIYWYVCFFLRRAAVFGNLYYEILWVWKNRPVFFSVGALYFLDKFLLWKDEFGHFSDPYFEKVEVLYFILVECDFAELEKEFHRIVKKDFDDFYKNYEWCYLEHCMVAQNVERFFPSFRATLKV